MSDLNGKVAIITGAASGLGEATALAIARVGASVALVDVDQARLEGVTAAIGRASPDANSLAIVADIADASQIEAAVARVISTWKRVDYLINNAGVDYSLPLTDLSVEQWDRVIGVNLRAPFLFARAVFPLMRRQGGGHVVNVASTAALRAWANASAYHASKHGLVGLTKALGVEGRAHNIRATALVPGGMRTRFFDRPDLEVKPDMTKLNDPANVAQAIVFVLAQPEGSVIQELLVTPLTETSWP